MKRPDNYKTWQHKAIVDYIISMKETHVTAAQIVERFKTGDISIGRATVYRHLIKMTEDGKLRRYTTDGIHGACYQYINNSENCHSHLHLKCEECGELQHLECKAIEEIQQHVLNRHYFEVNALKTVLYGKCVKCLDKM